MLIPALLVALQGSLLPAGPEGWRFERIPFPLEFAPELEFEGVEELRFAPGMFTPDSDSYFSYAFGIRLEGAHEVDEAFLTSFLTTYYRGLCRAVGQERFPERDPGTVQAEVRDLDGRFVARIDLYDPFTDGRDLDLWIELDVHRTARTTELLGLASLLASPMASPIEENAIWRALHGLRADWEAQRPAPVLLNHVFAVVDEDTWAALEDCEPLRDLAVFERRTTERGDLTYTGLYFYGKNTYFEFLKPDIAAGFPPGRTGIAFGCDRAGGVDALRARLEASQLVAFPAAVTRSLEGTQVPWFQLLGLALPAAAAPLDVFAMEYDPAFLERWHADLALNSGGNGIARRTVLARYAAALEHAPGLFRDVTAIDLALDEAGRKRLMEAAEAFGFESALAGSLQILRGPDFVLRLHPLGERSGLVGFDLSLDSSPTPEALDLGRVTIRFSGRQARVDL